MKIRMMFLMFCVLAFTPAVFSQVHNGSFEEGINPGDFTFLLADSTVITGWQVDSGNIDYIGTHWQAAEGSRSVDMNGFQAGKISQTIATTPGFIYQVTFSMSGNPDGNNLFMGTPFYSSTNKTMVVSVNGGSQSSVYSYNTSCDVDEFSNPLGFCNSREDMKWVTNTYSFAATSSSTVLSFASTIPGFFGPVLDNVSVEAISATVCHRDNGKREFKTITVGVSAVPAHLAHGDSLGQCVSN